jgi:two-component system, OmpR family, sensor histidine kinase ChvG
MASKRFMVRATALPTTETAPPSPEARVPLRFGIASLTTRILIVNILTLALMAAAFFYLDSFRTRLVDARIEDLTDDMRFAQIALNAAAPDQQTILLTELAQQQSARIRAYDSKGTKIYDSFAVRAPTYVIRDPAQQAWERSVAQAMDRGIDWFVGAQTPEPFTEPAIDMAKSWPEIAESQQFEVLSANRYRIAPDLTPVFSVATSARLQNQTVSLLLTTNARDITRTVRAERLRLGIALGIVLLFSMLLSFFLARTIVKPLRRLADAAVLVRMGRARDVIVPRLPARRDEIGQLARALSDMTQTLRERIDAGEFFAADVTHELKNPLASLRSSLDTLDRVSDPALKAQLLAVAKDDCQRLDRLVNDISEASRVDAQLSRTRFEPVDLGKMIEGLIAARTTRHAAKTNPEANPEAHSEAIQPEPKIAFARPLRASATVAGDGSRLERVFDNLIDNALSFSPPSGLVRISATLAEGDVIVRVDDEGPGVMPDQREAIFRRFHTERPPEQAFGKHSGLGLAIARTIVQAHEGSIVATDRADGRAGACFEVRIPAYPVAAAG